MSIEIERGLQDRKLSISKLASVVQITIYCKSEYEAEVLYDELNSNYDNNRVTMIGTSEALETFKRNLQKE